MYVVTAPGFAANLAPGTMIDGASTYGANTSSNTAQFNLNSTSNLVGFRFLNEANNQVHYGWFRVGFGAAYNGADRVLLEYAYEGVAGAGIGAGVIPAPGSLALLGIGALGVAGRRRK